MTGSRLNLLLWLATAAFAAGTLVVAAWAVFAPYAEPVAPGLQVRAGVPAPAVAPDPPLAAFEEVWDADLGGPLVPPPPPRAAPLTQPAVATAPPPPMRLIGTIVEPGYSVAVFAGPDGRVEQRAVGEKAGGAEVLRIESGAVTVRHNGAPLVLPVAPPEAVRAANERAAAERAAKEKKG